ncbi:hypothetical protein RJ639_023630 [Escallonia herrerae]|uniref:Uncharacterized protein n=1 Tax=Escallonia herrerae TaxID=1293975 RepID=A0AA88V0I8_9ASTE|nr:hypothetical protein RJ639_023630 [Escallonia herrerae]
MKAGVNATMVEAFDISDTANDVYQHNFGHRPFQVYMLFHKSQRLQKDSNDARASSFLKILELMPQTSQPPVMLIVENVVGFEACLINIFYLLQAKRKPLSFQNPLLNQQLIRAPGPLFGQSIIVGEGNEPQGSLDKSLQACEPVRKFLEFKHPSNEVQPESSWLHINVPGALESSAIGSLEQYFVPLSLLERWGNAMVHSMDYMQLRAEDKIVSLEGLRLKYFTPREVANLHSFPENFNFPRHISLRQRYIIITCSMLLVFVYSYTYPPTVKSLE